MSRKRDIYIAIMVAAANGRGINLTVDEVRDLSMDDAIETRAANGLDSRDWPTDAHANGPSWTDVDPYRERSPENLTFTRSEIKRRSDAS